jgi:hypothetical protein
MTHVFIQAIQKEALLPIHLAKGIELYEPDDRILILRCKGEVINTYPAKGVTVEQIRKDADEYLERIEK